MSSSDKDEMSFGESLLMAFGSFRMMNMGLKKLFGGFKLSWPKLIIFAVIAGVYTAVMALIPALKYTSFSTITTTFEVLVYLDDTLPANGIYRIFYEKG